MPCGQPICILTGAFWTPDSTEETCNTNIVRKETFGEHFFLKPYYGSVYSTVFPQSSPCLYYLILYF